MRPAVTSASTVTGTSAAVAATNTGSAFVPFGATPPSHFVPSLHAPPAVPSSHVVPAVAAAAVTVTVICFQPGHALSAGRSSFAYVIAYSGKRAFGTNFSRMPSSSRFAG